MSSDSRRENRSERGILSSLFIHCSRNTRERCRVNITRERIRTVLGISELPSRYVPLSALYPAIDYSSTFPIAPWYGGYYGRTPAKLGSFSRAISDVRIRASVVSLEIAPLKGRKRRVAPLIAVCQRIIDAISRGLHTQPAGPNSAYR